MEEAHAQAIIVKWFRNRGFDVEENSYLDTENEIDVIAKKGLEQWIIEVKGDYDKNTAQYNVNFDTGMGQILKSITKIDNNTKYAICIPFGRTERGERLSYRLILPKYSKSVIFEVLNLHLVLVRDDESVEIVMPKGIRRFLSDIDTRIRV
jgi:hypothetical protein